MPTLADTQQLLWRLIAAPEGVAAALAADSDRGGTLTAALQCTVRGDARLSAVERLDIYANMYFFRILDVLKEDYPATCALLGDVAFHNIVTDYLLSHAPTHFSIREAGRHLPAVLAAHAAASIHPSAADLARFERALNDAFDAAVEVALLVLEVLDDLGLESGVKTTGGKGLHIVVPIERRYDDEAMRAAASRLTWGMGGRLPSNATTPSRIAKRWFSRSRKPRRKRSWPCTSGAWTVPLAWTDPPHSDSSPRPRTNRRAGASTVTSSAMGYAEASCCGAFGGGAPFTTTSSCGMQGPPVCSGMRMSATMPANAFEV